MFAWVQGFGCTGVGFAYSPRNHTRGRAGESPPALLCLGAGICFASFGANVKPFVQSGFDFRQVIADGLTDFENGQHAVSSEFVNRPQRQAAMSGEFVTGDFLRGEDWS